MTNPPESFQARSFRFACDAVRLYVRLAALPGFPLHIARQFLRAGTSVGANLADAKAAQTRRDLASKFSIALKESQEAVFWLMLTRETGLAPALLLEPAISDGRELIAILTVSRRKLNTKEG